MRVWNRGENFIISKSRSQDFDFSFVPGKQAMQVNIRLTHDPRIINWKYW